MPIEQTIQLALLACTSLLFGMAFILGLRHMRSTAVPLPAIHSENASMGPPARAAVLAAMLLGFSLLIWRSFARQSPIVLPSDPFDAFLLLGLLLACAVIYFRWTRHLKGLSFFMLPMIVVLLLLGVILGAIHPVAGDTSNQGIWMYVHISTIVAGTLCFALACVGGGVYLLADRQLRHRGLDASYRWIGLPPLASIEKFNRWMLYIGFPLLTLATVSGVFWIVQSSAGAGPGFHHGIKIVFGGLSWLVYALLLHVPLTPQFRGRRAAWLSIVGFALFIGAFLAARWN